jgi:hypothetical protein
MSDGGTVEDAIDAKQDELVSGINIKTINGKSILGQGNINLYSSATSDDLISKDDLNTKVDKEEGKQLSTEDFTTELKNKLELLVNYDDSAINNAIDSIRSDFESLIGSSDVTSKIDTFNEIVEFLNGISNTDDLDNIVSSIQNQILSKQDIIPDLDAIRSGAAKGATAIQSIPEEYVTEAELTGKGYATTNFVNTELNKKQNTISDLDSIRSGANKGATALQSFTESDPIFKASAAYNITSSDISN